MEKLKTPIKRIYLIGCMYVLLFLFLGATNPDELPVIFLILPVVWLFATLVLTILALASFFKLNVSQDSTLRQVGYASLAASIPTGLLLLQSINQLTAKDTFLYLIFAVVALVYVRRFRFSRKNE